MAIFIPGPIVAGISGTLNGMNFANTSRGPIIRKALTRTKRRGASSLKQRARFHFLIFEWRNLSDAQRTLWTEAARALPRQNPLGTTRSLSGFQLFLSLNLGPFAPPHADWLTPPTAQLSPQPESLVAEFKISTTLAKATTKAAPPALAYQAYYGQRGFRSEPVFRPNSWTWLATQLSPLDSLNLWTLWVAALGAPSVGEWCAIKVWRKDNGLFPALPVFAIDKTVA